MTIHWTQQTTLTALLTALAGVVLVATLELSPLARLVPRVVLAPTLTLLLLQLLLDLAPKLEARFAIFERAAVIGEKDARMTAQRGPAPDGSEAASASTSAAERAVFGWIAALLALVFLLGFAVGTPLFALVYVHRKAGQGWWTSVAFAIGVALFTLGVFQEALGARLWTGQLWSWLGF